LSSILSRVPRGARDTLSAELCVQWHRRQTVTAPRNSASGSSNQLICNKIITLSVAWCLVWWGYGLAFVSAQVISLGLRRVRGSGHCGHRSVKSGLQPQRGRTKRFDDSYAYGAMCWRLAGRRPCYQRYAKAITRKSPSAMQKRPNELRTAILRAFQKEQGWTTTQSLTASHWQTS